MSRTLLGVPVVALAVLVWGAAGATPPQEKAPAKAGPARQPVHSTAAAKKQPAVSPRPGAAKTTAATRTAASRTGKKAPAPRTTWRNRQMAPSPERYREIQEALVARGFLKPEDANGTWSPASTEALKNFQAGQNLDASGKINSLSLIALGLGPRRDATAPVKPPAPAQVPEGPGPGR
ncbi:MAG: peptidoglycan-binding protein [Acidobacteriia bacterium]|nr:peptidoglycan-binding protein [Terriglobia bacterium]